MKIASLLLENFRNYDQAEIVFSKGLNVIIGENGKGKTNVLEAIFSLSFSKPFRSSKKEVFVRHGADYSRLRGVFASSENSP